MLGGTERVNPADLIDRFGGPEGAFAASAGELEGFHASFVKSLLAFKDWDRAEREMELAAKKGARVVAYEDPSYPGALRLTYDPPFVLYMVGNEYREEAPAVAIVGTRHPTRYGTEMAETLGRALAYAGVNVVSGMARGCDASGHKGALKAGGFTTAVLGTGADVVYPPEAGKLYSEIIEKGVVVSEYLMGTPPQPRNFPRRNRIISGLSLGVAVVEAPLRSGSLMTARLSLEYGREVFAFPGQVNSMRSSGTNRLIKDGAALIEGAKDIMEALGLASPQEREQAPAEKPEGDELLLYNAIGKGMEHIDSLCAKTGLSAARASTLLLEMELKGIVEQKPGKSFLRRI
ncbi:DNA processing protein DprA [Gammaproteobacteria bacterium]|nr:DNA processing protein DprA [Gammaproteobacteria bacterium]